MKHKNIAGMPAVPPNGSIVTYWEGVRPLGKKGILRGEVLSSTFVGDVARLQVKPLNATFCVAVHDIPVVQVLSVEETTS